MVRRQGRTEADMDLFYAFLGKENAEKIKFAVMDMWKPFRKSTQRTRRKAAILFDKFHIVKHLGDALDDVRRSEYKRVTGEERSFIKGQRYVLFSRRENLTRRRRKNLERLLQANARLEHRLSFARAVRATLGLCRRRRCSGVL